MAGEAQAYIHDPLRVLRPPLCPVEDTRLRGTLPEYEIQAFWLGDDEVVDRVEV